MTEERPKDELGIQKIAAQLQKVFGEKDDPNAEKQSEEPTEDGD